MADHTCSIHRCNAILVHVRNASKEGKSKMTMRYCQCPLPDTRLTICCGICGKPVAGVYHDATGTSAIEIPLDESFVPGYRLANGYSKQALIDGDYKCKCGETAIQVVCSYEHKKYNQDFYCGKHFQSLMDKIGLVIRYFDEHSKVHDAIVTNDFNKSSDKGPLNLVFVSTDETKQDQYGQQIERRTSVAHITQGYSEIMANCWCYENEYLHEYLNKTPTR